VRDVRRDAFNVLLGLACVPGRIERGIINGDDVLGCFVSRRAGHAFRSGRGSDDALVSRPERAVTDPQPIEGALSLENSAMCPLVNPN
jgi:hypothetical protein